MNYKHIFIFLLISYLNTSLFANDDPKFSNELWYKSIEINDLLNLVTKYKNECNESIASNTCETIKNRISILFEHHDLNEASITFVVNKMYSNQMNNDLSEIDKNSLIKTLYSSAITGKENNLNKIFNDPHYPNKVRKAMEIQKSQNSPAFLVQYDVKKEYLAAKELHKLYTFSICGLSHNMIAMGSHLSSRSYIPCLNQYDHVYLRSISSTNYFLKNIL